MLIRSALVGLAFVLSVSSGHARSQTGQGTANPATQPAAGEVEYQVPTKEVKLASQQRDMLLSAKTVVLVARTMPLLRKNGDKVIATYRGTRVGPDKPKADMLEVLKEWGAFEIVDTVDDADLVLFMYEETIPPAFGSKADIQGPKYRLKQTLAVFPGKKAATDAVWVGVVTESLMHAELRRTPDARGVVEEFRGAYEAAKKQARK